MCIHLHAKHTDTFLPHVLQINTLTSHSHNTSTQGCCQLLPVAFLYSFCFLSFFQNKYVQCKMILVTSYLSSISQTPLELFRIKMVVLNSHFMIHSSEYIVDSYLSLLSACTPHFFFFSHVSFALYFLLLSVTCFLNQSHHTHSSPSSPSYHRDERSVWSYKCSDLKFLPSLHLNKLLEWNECDWIAWQFEESKCERKTKGMQIILNVRFRLGS